MATADILGIPKSVHNLSSYDEKLVEKLTEQVKAMSSYRTLPGKIPFQYDFSDAKGDKNSFETKLPALTTDWPPLVEASYHGHIRKGEELLLQKSDVNATSLDGVSALLAASTKGHTEVVRLLIKYGAKIDMMGMGTNVSSLLVASQNGHYAVVKLLLKHGAQPDLRDSGTGITALMLASLNGHYGVVELLLESGAKPNIQDISGMFALFLAILNRHYTIVKLLLIKGAIVNMNEENGLSGLALACQAGLYEMAKLLLEHGAQVNLKCNLGNSPLTLASILGHHKVARLLIRWGAEIDSQDTLAQTALMGASFSGHYGLVKLLLNNGAQPNLTTSNGISALMIACSGGHYKVTQLLLQKGAQPNWQDNKGNSPLHCASAKGHNRVAKLLIEKAGVQVNLLNRAKLSPLMIACINGHCSLAELLIQKYANVNLQGASGASALLLSIRCYEMVLLLLDSGADPNVVDNNGWSPLMVSSSAGLCDVTKLLIDRGAPVNVRSDAATGRTPLSTASCNGKYEVAKLLLESGAHPNMPVLLIESSPIMFASANGHYKIVKLLLDYGALPNMRTVRGNTSIHLAVFGHHQDIAALLITWGAQPNLQNQNQHSALTMATLQRDYEMTKLVLGSQVDKANLWCAFKISINLTEDKATAVLLFKMCLQIIRRNEQFVVDSGVVFWGTPIRHCITSQGATIQLPHIGISLAIPEQTLSSTEEDIDLLIHPCFSGPFELPAGYESASPAYLIQPSRKVEIQRDITLQIQHYASLQNEEDCEEMAFLSASPQYGQSKPVYVFKEITQSIGVFKPNSQVGEITIQHFCCLKIGRNRRRLDSTCKLIGKGDAGVYYSARLYRCVEGISGLSAVFCMCLYHPIYTEHCDRIISEEYKTLSCLGESKSNHDFVQMRADEVTLSVRNSKGWNVTFDRNPTKIKKREVDVPELFTVDLCKLTDYPPKFSIFVHPTAVGTVDGSSPQLVVQGLDVEECSFEIITPGNRRSSSLSASASDPSQSSTITTGVLKEAHLDERTLGIDLCLILTELATINKDWFNLGIALEIESHKLEEIEANFPKDVKKCMAKVISKWLEKDTGHLSWRTLCDALRSELVDQSVLAERIEKKYCTK